jgi:hypothetical protein
MRLGQLQLCYHIPAALQSFCALLYPPSGAWDIPTRHLVGAAGCNQPTAREVRAWHGPARGGAPFSLYQRSWPAGRRAKGQRCEAVTIGPICARVWTSGLHPTSRTLRRLRSIYMMYMCSHVVLCLRATGGMVCAECDGICAKQPRCSNCL